VRSEPAQQEETGREAERAHLAGSPTEASDGDAVATPDVPPELAIGGWHLRLTIVVLAVTSLDVLWLIWIGYGVYGRLAR
jgi:hypothetical protein